MRIALSVKNKVRFINGSLPAPPISQTINYSSWMRNNQLVILWILNSVSKEISTSIMFTDSAQIISDNLKDRYQHSNMTQIFQIHIEIVNLNQNKIQMVSTLQN